MNEKPKSKIKTIILAALVVVVILAALVYSNQKPNVNYDSASMSAISNSEGIAVDTK